MKRGQCYHTPYFGCREFPVNFREYEFDSVPTAYAGEDKKLGYMLYDMDYSDLQHIGLCSSKRPYIMGSWICGIVRCTHDFTIVGSVL